MAGQQETERCVPDARAWVLGVTPAGPPSPKDYASTGRVASVGARVPARESLSCLPDSGMPPRRIVQRVAKAGTERGITAATEHAEPVGIPTSERHRMNVIRSEVGRLMRDAVNPWTDVAMSPDPCVDEGFPPAPASSRTLLRQLRHGFSGWPCPSARFSARSPARPVARRKVGHAEPGSR